MTGPETVAREYSRELREALHSIGRAKNQSLFSEATRAAVPRSFHKHWTCTALGFNDESHLHCLTIGFLDPSAEPPDRPSLTSYFLREVLTSRWEGFESNEPTRVPIDTSRQMTFPSGFLEPCPLPVTAVLRD
jgi:hypothetical protein